MEKTCYNCDNSVEVCYTTAACERRRREKILFCIEGPPTSSNKFYWANIVKGREDLNLYHKYAIVSRAAICKRHVLTTSKRNLNRSNTVVTERKKDAQEVIDAKNVAKEQQRLKEVQIEEKRSQRLKFLVAEEKRKKKAAQQKKYRAKKKKEDRESIKNEKAAQKLAKEQANQFSRFEMLEIAEKE